MSDSCIFCAIVAGEAPARVVYEDEATLAFLDIAPITTGHTLVVPRVHAADIFAIDPEALSAVARTAQTVGKAAMTAFGAEGLNLLQSNGAIAFQSVFHLHVHVLPRYPGDGFSPDLARPPGDPSILDANAETLRAAF